MAERPINNPGRVLIAGENHILRLQTQPGGPDAALVNHFRLRLSPHGPGHAVFVLAEPNAADPRNACYTDNPALANWLLDWYLGGSPLYRELKGTCGPADRHGRRLYLRRRTSAPLDRDRQGR